MKGFGELFLGERPEFVECKSDNMIEVEVCKSDNVIENEVCKR